MSREEHKRLLQCTTWRRLRLAVIAENGSRCQLCMQIKAAQQLDVHHDPPVDETTTVAQFFERRRLFCLCRPCHSTVTARTAKKSKPEPIAVLGPDGLLTDQWIEYRKNKRRRKRRRKF